jgi:hypothetical protein
VRDLVNGCRLGGSIALDSSAQEKPRMREALWFGDRRQFVAQLR